MLGRYLILSCAAASASLVAASSELLSGSTQLHRWANGEAGFECNIQCNGKNVAHIKDFPDSWPLYSCWGEFKSECTGTAHESYTVTSITKCEGAFTTVRHAAEDDGAASAGQQRNAPSALDAVRESLQTELQHHSHDMLEGKNVTFFGCEGRYFSLTKSVPMSREEREEAANGDASVASATDLTSLHMLAADIDADMHGHKHHHKKCKRRHNKYFDSDNDEMKGHIMGAVCAGKMHNIVVSPAPHNATVLVSCSDAFMAGKGVKLFPPHASAHKILKKFKKAEKHLTKKLTKHAPISGGAMAPVESAPGHFSSVVPDELLAADANSASACTAAGDAPAHCRATCNHHPLSWHGWWPCKGELEVGCEGSKEMHGTNVCYLFDAKCIGLSWPKFKACSGLWTELTEAAGETKEGKQFSVETLSISNGFRKAKEMSKHGWKGMLVFGKGPSSLRVRGGVAKDEESDVSAGGANLAVEDADAVLRADVV